MAADDDETVPEQAREAAVNGLQAAGRLAIEATQGVIDVVEAMHHNIASGPAILGRPLQGPSRLFTRLAYGSVRGVTQLVGASIDAVLGQSTPLLAAFAPEPGAAGDALLAVLNGVVGDHLSDTHKALAIQMQLRREGRALALEQGALREAVPNAGDKLLVMIHGSCRNDLQWGPPGHDYGAQLARDLGYSVVYLYYNTGLHISTNGRALSALLEQLVTQWPVPVAELALLAHSMGGLVARSACHYARADSRQWLPKLHKLVCLGTPHHGAPLERGGSWLDLLLGVSSYSAPLTQLAKIRSAGVTDMRFGNVVDEHWHGRDRFARAPDARGSLELPEGVDCYAIAASTSREQSSARPASDGLVPVDSALGRHAQPQLTLAFPAAHQWIGFGMGHLEMLGSPAVYAKLKQWLAHRQA